MNMHTMKYHNIKMKSLILESYVFIICLKINSKSIMIIINNMIYLNIKIK